MNVTFDDVFNAAPKALEELTHEVFRRAVVAISADKSSQLTACLQLGLRSASIMHGMAMILDLPTLDSYESLNRSAVEARDLLMNFRFDDNGTREKTGYWFAGAKDNAWKADHNRVEDFLKKHDLLNVQLGLNWSKVTALTHPTKYAAENSVVVVLQRMTSRLNGLNIEQKRADYVVGVSRLIMATVYDVPGWISLGLNFANIPSFPTFCRNAELIAAPIVNAPLDNPLPAHSVRPPKKTQQP